MDVQQMPIEKLLATVLRTEKFQDVKNRPFKKVGFLATFDQPDYFDGPDFRKGFPCRVYVDGTKEVADIIAAAGGLRPGERIYLRVVGFGAFGGGGVDDEGRQRTPMLKFTVDHIELPGRPYKNRPLKELADKVREKDAGAAAEYEVLGGVA